MISGIVLSHFIMLWVLLFITYLLTTSVHMRWPHLSTQHTDGNLRSWLFELANEPTTGPGTYIHVGHSAFGDKSAMGGSMRYLLHSSSAIIVYKGRWE